MSFLSRIRGSHPPTERIESILGPSVQFKGSLKAKGGIRIDGHVNGAVESESNVIVGENARVIADVSGFNVTVAGYIQGTVKAIGRLEILSSGTVSGDVQAGSLLIEEGGTFHGQSMMEIAGAKLPQKHKADKPEVLPEKKAAMKPAEAPQPQPAPKQAASPDKKPAAKPAASSGTRAASQPAGPQRKDKTAKPAASSRRRRTAKSTSPPEKGRESTSSPPKETKKKEQPQRPATKDEPEDSSPNVQPSRG